MPAMGGLVLRALVNSNALTCPDAQSFARGADLLHDFDAPPPFWLQLDVATTPTAREQ
jgi:hypothetical protein